MASRYNITWQWKALQTILYGFSLFMLAEALYHMSGLRLTGTETAWPESAQLFLRFFFFLWASASLFTATLFWIAASNLPSFRRLIVPFAFLGYLHSAILLYFAGLPLTENIPNLALVVWNPYYNWQLIIEACIISLIASWALYTSLQPIEIE